MFAKGLEMICLADLRIRVGGQLLCFRANNNSDSISAGLTGLKKKRIGIVEAGQIFRKKTTGRADFRGQVRTTRC